MLGIAGGTMGVMAGLLASWIVGSTTQWQTYVTADSIIVSVAFSISVGLMFGVAPAMKAAALDPIQALQKD